MWDSAKHNARERVTKVPVRAIREVNDEYGARQSQLAKMAGVSPTRVAQLLRGERSEAGGLITSRREPFFSQARADTAESGAA